MTSGKIAREDRKIRDATEPADTEKAKRPRQNLDKPANGVTVDDHMRGRCAGFDVADAHDISPPAGGCPGAVSGRPLACCSFAHAIRGRLSVMAG